MVRMSGSVRGAMEQSIVPTRLVDFSDMSQLAYEFNVGDANVNGNAPSKVESIEITVDGTVFANPVSAPRCTTARPFLK